MDGAERRNFLIAIVDNASKTHRAWAEGGDTHLLPEDELYQRFNEIAEQGRFINAQRASDLERMFLNFGAQWRSFVASQQQNMDVGMLPGERFWEAWEALEAERAAAKTPQLKEIEPIETLVAQKVSERQICMIYGFMLGDGSPDFRKLREEIKEPGKHTGPETEWVAPVNEHIVRQIKLDKLDRDAIRRRRDAKVSAANTPAPESIEMLVADNVSGEQIARMKKITTDEVYAYCKANNLPAPPLNYEASLQAPKAFDRDKGESLQRVQQTMGNQPTGPIGDDDDAVIDPPEVAEGVDLETLPIDEQNKIGEARDYAAQGMKPRDIAKHMNLKTEAVRELLRKGGLEAVANS